MSQSVSSLMAAAFDAESKGDFMRSEALYREVLTQNPGNLDAYLYHSLTLSKLGRSDQAILQLQRIVSQQPKNLIALNWLSKLFRESGQIEMAVKVSEQAILVNPNHPEVIYNLGLCYLEAARYEEAIFCLERSTQLIDSFAPGYYSLACAYESIGQPWPALAAIRKSVAIDPNDPGHLKLAQLYLEVGDLDHAAEYAEKALVGIPSPTTHLVLSEALASSDPERSQAHYETAIQGDSMLKPVSENRRAKQLSRMGKLDEAQVLNAELMMREPPSGNAYLNWVTIKRITHEDQAVIDRMERLLETHVFSWESKSAFHFALGKSYDDLGLYEKAMMHYDQANHLKFAKSPSLRHFDSKAFRNRIDQLIQLFDPSCFAKYSSDGNLSSRPIFVVGMMRTGTTLMEQILSRHPAIAAGGELAHWAFAEKKIVDYQARQIRGRYLKDTSASYLDLLESINSDAEHVSDKNPANVLVAGLLQLAFPNAHIIQMERNAVDTAMSIYITPTRTSPEFGCHRENIVSAIQEVKRLTDHWHSVLPESNYHVVRYEELVSDPKSVVAELLKSCGLDPAEMDWNHSASRSIIGTPSLWQARQPITTSSVGRRQRYETWLGAFKKLD